MTNIENALDGGNVEQVPLWVGIPSGYAELPLEGIAGKLGTAEDVLGDIATGDQKAQAHALIGVLEVFLNDLATTGAVYCGIGRHTSPEDDAVVTSTLVVSHQEYEGTRNPRLLLGDLLSTKSEAGEQGQADLVDVLERPVLFFERVRSMPTPQFPGQPEVDEDATSPIFQLEAHIPSEDGSEMALIEFSTPFVSHGPEFRAMIVQMASSVSFEPPQQSDSSSRIQQLLG